MTLTYRAIKGTNLIASEVDGNFHDLDDRVVDLETNPPIAVSVASFSVVGNTFTVHMTDGSVLGPYPLPTASWRWRGNWAAATAYSVNDTFAVPDDGIYLVLQAFTSATDFDPTESNTDGPVLALLLGIAPPQTVVVLTFTANHTADSADFGAYVRLNKASGSILYSIPEDADMPAEIGTTVSLRQVDDGQVAVDPMGAVTVNTPETLFLRKAGSTATLIKSGANEWDLAGDLELA